MDLDDLFFPQSALREAEQDCSAHTVKMRVRFTGRPLLANLDPDTVAGLLRTLAASVDGYCTYRGARSVEFRDPGMVFRFTDVAKRDRFSTDCKKYLSDKVFSALAFTPF